MAAMSLLYYVLQKRTLLEDVLRDSISSKGCTLLVVVL